MSKGVMMMNGDLVFPKDDCPKEASAGYLVDQSIPWIHYRIYKPCRFRSSVNIPTPCGARRDNYYCERQDTMTTFKVCDPCSDFEIGEFKGESGLLKQK